MSSFRAGFKLESVGYYPRGKSVYLTVSSNSSFEDTKISVLLDRNDTNLSVLGDIIRDQTTQIRLTLESDSRTRVPDKNGREIIRFRAIAIECEHSTHNY